MSTPYGPGHSAFDISPDNSEPIANGPVRAVYVGVGGDITGRTVSQSGSPATVTFTAVPTGTVLPVAFTHIHVTGTDADDMVGLL